MMWLTRQKAALRVVTLLTLFLFVNLTACTSVRQRVANGDEGDARNQQTCVEIREAHQCFYDSERDCWRYWEPEDPRDYNGEGEWVCSPDCGGREVIERICDIRLNACERHLGWCVAGLTVLAVLVVGAIVFASAYGSRPRTEQRGYKGGDEELPEPVLGATVEVMDQSGRTLAQVQTTEEGEILLDPEVVNWFQEGAVYTVCASHEGQRMCRSFQWDPERFLPPEAFASPLSDLR